jgi:hypothetical protein
LLSALSSSEFKISFVFTGSDLPVNVYGSALLPHPQGGVVILAGANIYHLPNAGQDTTWTLLPQKIKSARTWITAALVPDELVTCF